MALFEALSNADLDWEDVWVTLGDERWVDPHNSASNERLVREHLLRNAAARASFVGLKNSAPDPHAGAAAAWSALADLPRPFDYMVLGMGDDGHTASLFPESPGLAAALELSAPPGLHRHAGAAISASTLEPQSARPARLAAHSAAHHRRAKVGHLSARPRAWTDRGDAGTRSVSSTERAGVGLLESLRNQA